MGRKRWDWTLRTLDDAHWGSVEAQSARNVVTQVMVGVAELQIPRGTALDVPGDLFFDAPTAPHVPVYRWANAAICFEATWAAEPFRYSGRSLDVVGRALEFADHHHRAAGQVRKYTGEPYIQHPKNVADIVSIYDHSPVARAATLMHDVVEDTTCTLAEVEREFGREIASLVMELTDHSWLEVGNRAARKALDRKMLATRSTRAQTIKCADCQDNTESIATHDRAFSRVYLPEIEALLRELTKADAGLRALVVRQIHASARHLAIELDGGH